MAISEQQLSSWSRLGAQQGSANTYNSIKSALGRHQWPPGMDHDVYLQGSYPNHTNIRGDSDVDVVVESKNVFYHNVPDYLREQYGLTHGSYTWNQFRAEVRRALMDYYGSIRVSDGSKSIKVAGSNSLLNADVVPCNAYRKYDNHGNYASGITFWTRSNTQVINFPKNHRENGAQKNNRCLNRYKPNVRVFKNARSQAGDDFPSYFLECLIYNVPDRHFFPSHSDTFVNAVNFLLDAVTSGAIQSFLCQNEQQSIFGAEPHQIDVASAKRFVNAMADLWNNRA